MKTSAQWVQEKEVFRLTITEMIKRVQQDAYNSALTDVNKNVKLNVNGKQKGKNEQVYSPSKGVTNITIDEQSILGLWKDE